MTQQQTTSGVVPWELHRFVPRISDTDALGQTMFMKSIVTYCYPTLKHPRKKISVISFGVYTVHMEDEAKGETMRSRVVPPLKNVPSVLISKRGYRLMRA